MYWQNNPKDVSANAIISWLNNWITVAAVEQRGKPAGVVPSAVSYPSGAPGGILPKWWNPGCHYTTNTFRFPRGLEGLMTLFTLAVHLKQDDYFLQPILSMYDIRKKWHDNQNDPDTEVEGTMAWIGRHSGDVMDALGEESIT